MFNHGRLLDVFLLGPSQILVGLHIMNNIYLRVFMILVGISNIIYNGHNYLYFENRIDVWNIFNKVVNRNNGKTQIHRLYNLTIMYPIFIYIYRTTKLPHWLQFIFLWDIIIGFIWNFINFIKLL